MEVTTIGRRGEEVGHHASQKVHLTGTDWSNLCVRIICVVGASGAGKNSILDGLRVQDPRLKLIRSYTTRLPENDDERHGKSEYVFLPRAEFDGMYDAGKFAWATPPFAEARYGTHVDDLHNAVQGPIPQLLHVQPAIFDDLKRQVPATALLSFFVSVPDEAVVRERLMRRPRPLSHDKLKARVEQCQGYEDWARKREDLIIVDNCRRPLQCAVDDVVRRILPNGSFV